MFGLVIAVKSELCQRLSSISEIQFYKTHGKIPVPESLFNKISDCRPATLLKRDSKADEFCEFFKKFFFIEHLCVTASGNFRDFLVISEISVFSHR